MLERFLHENTAGMRLARTIVQGVIGVVIANLDVIFGLAHMDPTVKTILVALAMAILAPIMAEMQKGDE